MSRVAAGMPNDSTLQCCLTSPKRFTEIGSLVNCFTSHPAKTLGVRKYFQVKSLKCIKLTNVKPNACLSYIITFKVK